MPMVMNPGTYRQCQYVYMNRDGGVAECQKVFMNRDGGVAQVFTRTVMHDHGVKMNSVSFTAGNGAHNPLSGGSNNNWSILFVFYWKSAKGGALLYHNYNQRESIIKLHNDGRIEVWAARYDTGSDGSWYSTKLCEVGKVNAVLVNKDGQIFINGQNATPSSYGGDMPMWGEFKIFPDRDIDGVCFGLQGWNWNLGSNYVHVSNPITWPFETDPSNWAMSFDKDLGYRLNTLSGAQKNVTGTAVYEAYYWGADRRAVKI